MRVGFGQSFADPEGSMQDEDFFCAAGAERVFIAAVPQDSPGVLAQAVAFLRQGNIFLISSLQRIGHSLEEVIAVLEKVGETGASIAIGQDDISPGSQLGDALLPVSKYLASYIATQRRRAAEAGHLDQSMNDRERRGRGRPAVLSVADRERVQRLITDQGLTTQQAAKRFGVSTTTIYRILQNS